MPDAGFVGVRHREYTKVCDSAFLFRASSRCAGRRSNSKDDTKNGFMCMPHARIAGVGDSCKTELVLSCAVLLQCPTSAKPTLGIKGIKAAGIKQRVILLASFFFRLFAHLSSTPHARCAGVGCRGGIMLSENFKYICPTSAKPTLGIGGEKAEGIKQWVTLLASFFL